MCGCGRKITSQEYYCPCERYVPAGYHLVRQRSTPLRDRKFASPSKKPRKSRSPVKKRKSPAKKKKSRSPAKGSAAKKSPVKRRASSKSRSRSPVKKRKSPAKKKKSRSRSKKPPAKGRAAKSPAKKSPTRGRASKKSPVRIHVRKGTLSPFGYSSKLPSAQRQAALRKAARSDGWLPIFRKLNVLYIFNRNKNPALSKKFLADRNWVRANLS